MRSRLHKPFGVAMVAATASLTIAGCGASEEPAASTADETTTTVAVNSVVVEVASIAGRFTYEPGDTTVKVDEAVTWKNIDTTKHTVTAAPGQTVTFRSPNLATDETFVQTFSEPGVYKYFCSIHGESKMAGTITVTE